MTKRYLKIEVNQSKGTLKVLEQTHREAGFGGIKGTEFISKNGFCLTSSAHPDSDFPNKRLYVRGYETSLDAAVVELRGEDTNWLNLLVEAVWEYNDGINGIINEDGETVLKFGSRTDGFCRCGRFRVAGLHHAECEGVIHTAEKCGGKKVTVDQIEAPKKPEVTMSDKAKIVMLESKLAAALDDANRLRGGVEERRRYLDVVPVPRTKPMDGVPAEHKLLEINNEVTHLFVFRGDKVTYTQLDEFQKTLKARYGLKVLTVMVPPGSEFEVVEVVR